MAVSLDSNRDKHYLVITMCEAQNQRYNITPSEVKNSSRLPRRFVTN